MTDATQDPPSSAASVDSTTSAETSFGSTPVRSITPVGTVTVSARERSGTIIARTHWDSTLAPPTRRAEASGSTSTDNSRPETETEDDGDVDMDRDRADTSPERVGNPPQTSPHTRRAVGIVTDSPPTTTAGVSLEVNADAHIIINNGPTHGLNEVGVEDGIVSLEPNDDFAMGAPPGAPGAIEGAAPTTAPADLETRPRPGQPDVTPRAVTTDLPAIIPVTTVPRGTLDLPRHLNNAQIPARFRAPRTAHGQGAQHERHPEGPYRDEDVLLSLQLLAYLSKYPHVRQHFYKTRPSFHPATQMLVNKTGPSTIVNTAVTSPSNTKETNPIFKAFASATGRGKEKEKATTSASPVQGPTMRETNVFSLVERFTFRPSSSESELPNPPPTLPAEIQYWAGVIMRNACRKDESRGGIRQCANSKRSCIHPPLIKLPDSAAQCSAAVGRLSRASLPNADVVVRPSIVGRIVKVPLGVRGTGSGAVPRTLKTMGIITITTGSEELVLGLSEMAEHLRWRQRPLVARSREGQNDGPTGTDRERSSAQLRTETLYRGPGPFVVMLEQT